MVRHRARLEDDPQGNAPTTRCGQPPPIRLSPFPPFVAAATKGCIPVSHGCGRYNAPRPPRHHRNRRLAAHAARIPIPLRSSSTPSSRADPRPAFFCTPSSDSSSSRPPARMAPPRGSLPKGSPQGDTSPGLLVSRPSPFPPFVAAATKGCIPVSHGCGRQNAPRPPRHHRNRRLAAHAARIPIPLRSSSTPSCHAGPRPALFLSPLPPWSRHSRQSSEGGSASLDLPPTPSLRRGKPSYTVWPLPLRKHGVG